MSAEANLHKLVMALEEFRKFDREIPIQTMLIFLHIARRESVTMAELASWVDLSQASVSRSVGVLSDNHWQKGKQPFGLIKLEVDIMDTRKKIASISPKGRRVAATLEQLMEG